MFIERLLGDAGYYNDRNNRDILGHHWLSLDRRRGSCVGNRSRLRPRNRKVGDPFRTVEIQLQAEECIRMILHGREAGTSAPNLLLNMRMSPEVASVSRLTVILWVARVKRSLAMSVRRPTNCSKPKEGYTIAGIDCAEAQVQQRVPSTLDETRPKERTGHEGCDVG